MNIGNHVLLNGNNLMLKLYLNENLTWRIAKALREYGYDVISSHEANMDHTDDPTQFSFAVSQKRSVVTNNFSDFIALDEEYRVKEKSHYGIILTTKSTISVIVRRLRVLIETVSENDMKNQIRWLNEFDKE